MLYFIISLVLTGDNDIFGKNNCNEYAVFWECGGMALEYSPINKYQTFSEPVSLDWTSHVLFSC